MTELRYDPTTDYALTHLSDLHSTADAARRLRASRAEPSVKTAMATILGFVQAIAGKFERSLLPYVPEDVRKTSQH